MKALAAALTLVFTATILAQTPPATSAPDRLRKLSKRERAAKIEKLEGRFQDFLSDVAPIILPAEVDTFLALESDAQRGSFVDDFWRRREAAHGSGGRSFRDTYYERLEIAKEQFKKIESDRARMFLLHGPPNEVVRAECPRLLQPVEVWTYAQLPGVGNHVRLLFYKPRNHGEYRLWNPIGGSLAMNELMVGENPMLAEEPGARRPGQSAAESASPYSYINRIQLECRSGDEVMRAISSMVQSRIDLLKLVEPPQMHEEQAKNLLRSVVIANPDAPKLNAEFSVRYPTKDGSRTDVQMMLLVPRGEVTPAQVAGAEVYVVDVTGEVLKNGSLWEKYRYRFDFPGDFQGDKLPIVIDRLLRPAEYVSRIKVMDANGGAETIVESNLTVPEIFTPAEPQPAAVAQAASAPKTVAELKQEATTNETRLRILPPNDGIVSGIQKIETMITGDAIKAVEFWMDGKKIAVRRSAPFALDLDFGAVPMARRIRAVGLNAKNEPVTGDDIVVNTGTEPFSVRITSPRVAPNLTGAARVEMDVNVPDGEELAGVELYWNETRMATLYDPPFVQTVEIPASQGAGYLRAVAKVKSNAMPPVEDVVMINTPSYMEELNVHLVELPTTVLVDGKPTDKLTEKSFKVLDDGKPVPLAKFEYVKDLPLSIGLAIDTSGSMTAKMEEAQKAGAQFFESVMKRGDKGFVVAFDKEPRVVQKWSTKVADMHAGLARLRSEDMTALYDAIVYSLYNFHGVRGQRALIVISDGKDTASKFTYDQAMEYARRTGVPIYAIGIGIKPNDVDVRYKLTKLATETGGASHYIEQARDLQRVYTDIQNELRSQYILGFYPPSDVKPGGKWREVTVQVSEGKAKTIKGYFP